MTQRPVGPILHRGQSKPLVELVGAVEFMPPVDLPLKQRCRARSIKKPDSKMELNNYSHFL